jgi:hypothetical protein
MRGDSTTPTEKGRVAEPTPTTMGVVQPPLCFAQLFFFKFNFIYLFLIIIKEMLHTLPNAHSLMCQ